MSSHNFYGLIWESYYKIVDKNVKKLAVPILLT